MVTYFRLLIVPLAVTIASCCSIPASLTDYSFKASTSPEVHIPSKEGKFFVPISISNDALGMCFEETGKRNGIVPTLEVSAESSAPIVVIATDVSGLSGVHLKKGRTLVGSNSPIANNPIGYYLSVKDLSQTKVMEGRVNWRLVLKSPKAKEGQLIAKGVTKVRLREDGGIYLLLAEQIPFPSRHE